MITPNPGVLAYAVEETYPVGWTASNLNQSGNNVGGKCKWGLFFDSNERTFAYDLIPKAGTEDGNFFGVASFDGVSAVIGGKITLEFDRIPPKSPQ